MSLKLPTMVEATAFYMDAVIRSAENGQQREVERILAKTDLFFLLVYVLNRKDLCKEWLYQRCREVESNPDGYLDLWAREHGKSSLITFGLTIQDILNDPEITVGIFSFNRPTAKAFLRQIKREFESNEKLKGLFPDVLWANPVSEAPTWSEDNGIVVKREGNTKEATVEAWGLVDGQPTSKHYKLMVYDDVVTRDSVSTPDMVRKVTEAWELSRNLTTDGGKTRYIGTRYAHNDTYRTIIDRKAAIERRHAVTYDGTVDGEPVLWTREQVAEKRREQGPYTFSSQMLLDPSSDRSQGFRDEWLRFYDGGGDQEQMNKYLLVDAASSKKRESDYTAMAVIGLAGDDNFYLLDAIRDRMSLTERGNAVFELHRRWRPKGVGYEKYGQMSDIEYLKERMARDNYRFEITEVGGAMSKHDRIRRLVPVFENGRFYLPETLIKIDYEGRHVDIVRAFCDEEYRPFPVGLHEDLFDAISRIWDLDVVWPRSRSERGSDRYARPRLRRVGNVTYMAA
jgi:predicted phage terminase large subunit-like protein